MAKIVRVSIRPYRPPEHFLVKDLDIDEGEWVVVPQEHGFEVGQLIERPVEVDLPPQNFPPPIERLASTEEIESYFDNLEREKQAWKFCDERARHYGLSMKLVRVERQFDGKKITFYYFAENRVDFRELVKDLVRGLKTRVEMRQIGVRHEAKMVGGIGCCGREVCCATFIKEFAPVSIKMAKAQNLPLNPNKISGICGRLLCCLTFEYETYKDLQAELPSLGKSIELKTGEAKVIRQNVLKGTVTVLLPDGEEAELPVGEDGEVETEFVLVASHEDLPPEEEEQTPMPPMRERQEFKDSRGSRRDSGSKNASHGQGKRGPRKHRVRTSSKKDKGGSKKRSKKKKHGKRGNKEG